MKIRFTEHAVDRFVERRAPEASKEEAMAEMARLAEQASVLKERTASGDLQLLADGIVFVLKLDRADGLADCATILFDCRAGATNPLAEEIAQFGRMPIGPAGRPAPRRRRSRRASRW